MAGYGLKGAEVPKGLALSSTRLRAKASSCSRRQRLLVEQSSNMAHLRARQHRFPLFTALSKGLSVRGYTLREILSAPKLRAKTEQYVFDHVKVGNFMPRIDRVFPFAEIVEAHRYTESNEKIGKIVVTV
jgi:NADPH:quinone reductase-like Zn-dependent oxidoreductase